MVKPGLPKKYAKMGFKKGWREYKKTDAYKRRFGKTPKAKSKSKSKAKSKGGSTSVTKNRTISVSLTGLYMGLEVVKPALQAGAIEMVGDVIRGDYAAAQAKAPAVIEAYGNAIPEIVGKGLLVGVAKGLARRYIGAGAIGNIGPLKFRV